MVSFLLNAIPGAIVAPEGIILEIVPAKPEWIPMDVISSIGHKETAVIVSKMLGREVPLSRISTPVMKPGDVNWAALYQGPRLPEGATELPEGATLRFYRVAAMRGTDWPCIRGNHANCAGIHGTVSEFGTTADVFTCPCPHHDRKE